MRRRLLAGVFAAALLHLAPGSVAAADPLEKSTILFNETFDDPALLKRGWYDGDKFAISDAKPFAGKGCIEYAWKADTSTPATSSGIRRLFEPTDTVYLRATSGCPRVGAGRAATIIRT